jgi:hypothetical protein
MPHALEVVRAAEQELAGLLRRRAEMVKRISAIRQLLSDLVALFGESILDEELLADRDRRIGGSHRPGFTRACRAVLIESSGPLRAREASAELRRRFPELAERHRDLTASVTTVFHRFVKYAEARCFLDDDGVRVWQWALHADKAAPQPALGAASQLGTTTITVGADETKDIDFVLKPQAGSSQPES